ncbi:MAG: hypothetical protein NTY35_04235 [Planctomycetota bacterium]|nr:hypothetical protein [Planctomycetota bacterium]
MPRIALALAVWSLLLLAVTGLALLARPESGPPMPRGAAARGVIGALVPEREVKPEAPRRSPSPAELSGTVAPRIPETAPPPQAPARAAETSKPVPESPAQPAPAPQEAAGAAPSTHRDGGIPGLGALPPGPPAEEEGFGLHVLQADGRPANDATVRWMLQRDLDALAAQGRDPAAMDPADVLASSTHTTRTNSTGFGMLTSTAGTMLMDARLGDQYGWARIRREDVGHTRIVLAHDTTLDVEVVDAQGAPRARVPVVLRGASCQRIWTGSTGPDGRVQLRHADGVVRAARSRHEDLTIAVDVPSGATVALPRGEIPTQGVRLVAPPGQRVLVWVRDVAAAPCLRPTRVRLAPTGLESDCAAVRERAAVDGLAVFEDVPAGLSLVAIADSACSPDPLRAELRTTPAAETNVVLGAKSAMPRVRGRLLDPRGGPWREYDVVAHVDSAGSWLEQGGARTDDRGAFEVDVAALHVPDSGRASAPIPLTLVARNRYGRTVASARIELAPIAGQPLHDLGDVTANDWPVLVRGTVLDENERPLEGAPVEQCDGQGHPDPRTQSLSDERGQFVLRGPPPAEETILVRAVEPERRAAETTVALRRGDQRARLVIAIHGRLEGSVLLPAGAPEGSIVVRVDQASGAQLALSTDTAGAFAFSNVEAGDARIAFLPQGFGDPVFVLDSVGIPRGGVCRDPRLVGVDLRQLLVVVELEVVDERGQPILSGWAGPVSTGRARGRSYDMVDGVARVVVAKGGPALQVSADGYEPVVLQSPTGRVRIELKPSGQ